MGHREMLYFAQGYEVMPKLGNGTERSQGKPEGCKGVRKGWVFGMAPCFFLREFSDSRALFKH